MWLFFYKWHYFYCLFIVGILYTLHVPEHFPLASVIKKFNDLVYHLNGMLSRNVMSLIHQKGITWKKWRIWLVFILFACYIDRSCVYIKYKLSYGKQATKQTLRSLTIVIAIPFHLTKMIPTISNVTFLFWHSSLFLC